MGGEWAGASRCPSKASSASPPARRPPSCGPASDQQLISRSTVVSPRLSAPWCSVFRLLHGRLPPSGAGFSTRSSSPQFQLGKHWPASTRTAPSEWMPLQDPEAAPRNWPGASLACCSLRCLPHRRASGEQVTPGLTPNPARGAEVGWRSRLPRPGGERALWGGCVCTGARSHRPVGSQPCPALAAGAPAGHLSLL